MSNEDKTQKEKPPSRWKKFLNRFKRKKTLAINSKETAPDSNNNNNSKKEKKPGWFRKWRNRNKRGEINQSQEQPKTDEVTDQSRTKWAPKRKTKSDFSGEKIKNFFKVRFKKSKESIGRQESKESIQNDPENNTQTPTEDAASIKQDSSTRSKRNKRKKSSAEDSFSASFKRNFKKLKEDNMENFRMIKTFIKQDYKEKTMKKAVAKVEAKIQRRNESTASEGQSSIIQPHLHQGDDLFPMKKPKPKQDNHDGTKTTTPAVVTSPVKAAGAVKQPPNCTDIPMPINNNDNNGELFLASGKPFWQGRGKGDDEDDTTDDELAMNTEMLLKISAGEYTLTPLPQTPIVLDPYNKIEEMVKIDDILFTRDIIFSNTMRTLLNLHDDAAPKKNQKKDPMAIKQVCKWESPKEMLRYSPQSLGSFKMEKFNPQHSIRQ